MELNARGMAPRWGCFGVLEEAVVALHGSGVLDVRCLIELWVPYPVGCTLSPGVHALLLR